MNMIVTGILACEIGFWVALLAGLICRYIAGKRQLSTVILLCVPLLDILLLSLIAYDILVNGTTADFTHGLGAIYLGFTIAFGRQIISRIDAWFHHRFARGPAPIPPPKYGWAKVRYEWHQWLRMLLAALTATAVLGGLILAANNAEQTAEFASWILRVGLITAIWLVGWPIWETIRYALFPHSMPPHPNNNSRE